ncbi:MAG: hypothetical protein R3F33_13395 [Planctomycetota bacterium]
MAKRRDVMLEAFKVTRDQAIEAERRAQAGEPEGVGQRLTRSLRQVTRGLGAEAGLEDEPEAPPAILPVELRPRVRPQAPAVDPTPAPAPKAELTVSPWVLLGFSVTLGLLAFTLGYQLGQIRGRAEVPAVAAAPQAQTPRALPDPGAVPASPDALAESGDPSAFDAAFLDPANHFTIVVDQYNDNQAGRERAIRHYQYLLGQGFPVIQPRRRGDVVYLLVGATPGREDLEALHAKVVRTPYPGSQGRTFTSAYVTQIDLYF